uniref:Macrocin-O-methyltransferase domain-containing protein n=1 Tax=Trypanosoma congolense (strain IL3000) TaxID=1068625 RepID=G0UXC2_TRYCI|nr:conserved hypothetical protein [Trypanosoma congolense IL3000]
MFVLSGCRRRVASIESSISTGRCSEALQALNAKKASRKLEENTDYLRAVCFLAESRDIFKARQSLLEELRLFPENVDARLLLNEVNSSARPLLMPPEEVVKSEPLFGLLCDALLDHTMLTWTRLYSLYRLVKEVCTKGTHSSALIECGVSGGGSVVLMAVVAAHYSSGKRRIYALDTFSGMPDPATFDQLDEGGMRIPAAETSWGCGTCFATEENVRRLARNFGVEDSVVTVPGLFSDTLPLVLEEAGSGGVAMLHADADWYASTKCALECTWPAIIQGGVVQVDDYHYWLGCRKAVDEFVLKKDHGGSLLLQNVDNNAVYFIKP